MPSEKLRGGFRYLTIVSTSIGSVTISNVSVAIEFMPHWDDLRAYTGYFYADGEWIMNKAWYAGVSNHDFGVQISNDTGDRHTLCRLTLCPCTQGVRCHSSTLVRASGVPEFLASLINCFIALGWLNNATLGIAGPIIVDGAKRDRAVWPGDMGIAVPTQFVSTLDLLPTKNALSTQFSAINPFSGALPESGKSYVFTLVRRREF